MCVFVCVCVCVCVCNCYFLSFLLGLQVVNKMSKCGLIFINIKLFIEIIFLIIYLNCFIFIIYVIQY